MSALLEELNAFTEIKMAVATVYPLPSTHKSIDGVDYYLISQHKNRVFPDFESKYIPQCLKLINQVKPDLIHIHGTEKFYGMLGKHISGIPIIVSMQGLIGPCSEWFNYYGNINITEIIKMETVRRFLNGSSPFRGYVKLKKRQKRETMILQLNTHFVGRTDWDRSYVAAHNRQASYCSIPRILRKEFYNHLWSLDAAQSHRIFISNCRGPRSGADLMLKAFGIIKEYYPDSTLYIAGSNSAGEDSYQRYLLKLAKSYIGSCYFTGYLNPAELVDQFCKAHVFVHPTYIDNSPNSLAEAQVLGVPSVISSTGGKMSMVDHGKTGLLFPNGDKYLLADRVLQFFESDELIQKINQSTIIVARERHDPKSIMEKYLSLYKKITHN